MIAKYDKIYKEVTDLYDNGGGNTFYCGFKTLAPHYSIKEGGCTDWTGYAQSGKTELLLELLKNCSMYYGHKHLLYMPDAGSIGEVYLKLAHKITGLQTEKFYFNKDGERVEIRNRIKRDYLIKQLPWMHEYFKVYNPSEHGRPKSVTPEQFWEDAVKIKSEEGIFSAVIDSWNHMKHNFKSHSREDKYLEEVLSYRNHLAETSGLHFHTIIHPRSPKTNKDGRILMPDMHSLKGGSEWSSNGKSIIVVHRDFDSKITDIKIAKAKPKIVGVQGIVSLNYDISRGAYQEMVSENGIQRTKYAEQLKEKQLQIAS